MYCKTTNSKETFKSWEEEYHDWLKSLKEHEQEPPKAKEKTAYQKRCEYYQRLAGSHY